MDVKQRAAACITVLPIIFLDELKEVTKPSRQPAGRHSSLRHTDHKAGLPITQLRFPMLAVESQNVQNTSISPVRSPNKFKLSGYGGTIATSR
jgi:hypothetical protein